MTTAKAKPTTQAIETALEAGQERFEQAVKSGAETATKNMEQLATYARKHFEDSVTAMNEISGLSKGHMEALVASTQAATKGAEALTKAAADYSKKSMDELTVTMKTLTSAKSPKEFFEVNNQIAKANYDNFVAHSSKFTEMSIKMVNDVFEPLSSRMAVAMDKFSSLGK